MIDYEGAEYDEFLADIRSIQTDVLAEMGIDFILCTESEILGAVFSNIVFARMEKLGWSKQDIHTYK